MTLTDFQRELCETSPYDFSDLRALYVNCTLKPSPELSHTEGLMRVSMAIMELNGVAVDYVRALDHDLAPGVWPDMREHGLVSRAVQLGSRAIRASPSADARAYRLVYPIVHREAIILESRRRNLDPALVALTCAMPPSG